MDTNWSDDIAIAELSDEPGLSEELAAIDTHVADSSKPPHVVLNFSQVSYVNSSNLGQLLKLFVAEIVPEVNEAQTHRITYIVSALSQRLEVLVRIQISI